MNGIKPVHAMEEISRTGMTSMKRNPNAHTVLYNPVNLVRDETDYADGKDILGIEVPGQNLLTTGNMESEGWTGIAGNIELPISFAEGEGINGSKALVASIDEIGDEEYYFINSQELFHLNQYSRITISFMAKSMAPGIRLQAWVRDSGNVNSMKFGEAFLSSQWEEYNFSIVTDEQTSDNYKLSFKGFGPAVIFIDNVVIGTGDFGNVPQSEIYDVIIENGAPEMINVFRSECPVYSPGYQGMLTKYKKPFSIFAGRTISWAKFTVDDPVTVKVRINDTGKVPIDGKTVRILPSRYGIDPVVTGNEIEFTITEAAQYSVEVGAKGYENGLVLFADPPEMDIPDIANPEYYVLTNATVESIITIPENYSGIYFKKGIHDIDVFHVPSNIKNIYFEDGSWVYGALIMDGNPDVRIYGRGILSQARLDYRESHGVEAINGSDRIKLEGLVITDYKFFSVRLIGEFNEVSYTKVIAGWAWHCDGIAAYKGSRVSNCFIWANDDAIKVYRDSITWSDIVIWQLDNGGIIQMSWGGAIGGSTSRGVRLSRIDILHAEYDAPGFNVGLLSCVGNRRQDPGRKDWIEDWIIEDVVTENPVQIVFGITPDPSTPLSIHGLILKNWNVRMPMNTNFTNRIICQYPEDFFDGIVFDSVIFNGGLLQDINYITSGDMEEGGWTGEKGNTNQVVSLDDLIGVDNTSGLKSVVTDLGGDNQYFIHCNENFRFVSTAKLTLSFWAKANITGTQLIPIIYGNDGSNEIEFEEVSLIRDWRKYSLTIFPEFEFSKDYRLKFRTSGLNTVIFLDNVELGHPDWLEDTEMETQFLHPPLVLPAVEIIHTPVSVQEDYYTESSVYPNPTSQTLYIRNADIFTSYSIFNSTGSMVIQGTGKSVDVSDLIPGLYILSTGKGERIRFIKK